MLKERLSLIKSKIQECEILCDIGTDHAFLPIDIIKSGLCKRVIATDIRKGPLNVAHANAKKHVMLDKIELRLGNGLNPVDISEVDTVVVAGMGADVIISILQKDFMKAKKAKVLILQPMNSIKELRIYLYNNGFDIFDEELCEDENKLYNVICATYTGVVKKFELINIVVGDKLIQNNDPLLGKYVQKKLKINREILEGLSASSTLNKGAILRTSELIKELENIYQHFTQNR